MTLKTLRFLHGKRAVTSLGEADTVARVVGSSSSVSPGLRRLLLRRLGAGEPYNGFKLFFARLLCGFLNFLHRLELSSPIRNLRLVGVPRRRQLQCRRRWPQIVRLVMSRLPWCSRLQ